MLLSCKNCGTLVDTEYVVDRMCQQCFQEAGLVIRMQQCEVCQVWRHDHLTHLDGRMTCDECISKFLENCVESR